MPKLPNLTPRKAIRILERNGFKFVGQSGSHRIYVKGNFGVTIPYHNKDLRKGTLKAIIKQSNLPIESFIKQ